MIDKPTGAVVQQGDRSGALSRCIAVDAATFAAEHWGRAPLLTRRAELTSDFADLLDPSAVDELVSRRGLRTPFVRMAKDGSVISADRYTRGGGAGATADDQVADDRVLDLLANGSTLVLQALHRTWPPLVSFGSALAGELGHPVQINAYITPPQSQGFAAHYDVHDVFVLQIAGRKQWHIHAPVLVEPLRDQPWDQRRAAVAAGAIEPPLIDVVLEPGDALYLPRGYLHSATALGEVSIHLTVGVHPHTRSHLVEHLMTAARRDDALRASLPMGVDLADPDVLAPHLRDTVAALHRWLDTASATDVARFVGDELIRSTRPEPIGALAQLVAADSLDGSTRLRLRAAVRWRQVRDADVVRIVLLDKTIALPASCEPALKAVFAGEVLTPRELPGLDADEQLVLFRRLLREGIVVPA